MENIQKFDHRIRIVNNHKNMGTLYSRSIGALISRGEYIYLLINNILLNPFIYLNIIHNK